MTVDPCPHGDIAAACLDCLTDPPPERPAPPAPAVEREDGLPWAARFGGHCDACNTAIHEGQPICRMTDGTYQHDHCTGGRP